MERDELKKLGLNDEQVESVMTMHGKDFKNYTPKADYDALDKKFNESNSQLETLKTKAAGNDDLQAQIKALQDGNTKAQQDLKQEREQRLLEIELLKQNPVSLKALKAELDISKLKYNEDKIEGLDEQIKAFKENDLKILFKESAAAPPPANPGIKVGVGNKDGKQQPAKVTLESVIAEKINK